MDGCSVYHACGIVLALATAVAGCAPLDGDSVASDEPAGEAVGSDDWAGEAVEKAVLQDNGLQISNGLTTTNGLATMNGLTTTNGLRSINGLMMLNGLTTRNGLRTYNGLSVDCSSGSACSGEPDGLLSRKSGLMKDEKGLHVAKYLVGCALRADQRIRVKRWDGVFVTLSGAVGVAPEWQAGSAADRNGLCDSGCQERVSACLLALTNGRGARVSIVLTSPLPQIGTHTLSSHPYHEAGFFGNVFVSPPQAFATDGESYFGTTDRACSVPDAWERYQQAGEVCIVRYLGYGTCTMISGTTMARSCTADLDGRADTAETRTWDNIIGTWLPREPGVRPYPYVRRNHKGRDTSMCFLLDPDCE